jgi:hypothetical protein
MRINERPRGSRGRLALLALPAVLALGLFGCDDFLTTEPKAQLTTENFFTSAAQAEQATNATYAMLRNWSVHVFAYLGMTDIASDDATKGSVPADASFLLELDNINFDPGNNAFSGTWTGYYQGIYRANVAIQNIPDIEMDEQVRARLVGENQFLRAYYYAFLARAFGGVPLITEPLNPGEYFQPRATREAVFDQIEQDLNDAIAVLPPQSQYGPADIGRASRGAAQALLARVHLFQGEYQQAYDAATAVINSGEYSLYPDYAEIFTYDGENSSESVFEVQVIAVDGGNNGPSGGATQHAQVQGVRGPPNNLGWGFNTPSPDLEASYEPGDPRLQATILYPWENLKFSTDRLTWINPSMPNNRFNQKVQQPADNPGGSGNSGVNIRVIRYSDVLLMAAEAAYQLGNTGEATTWLNMVRERARGDNTVTAGFTAEMLDASVTTGVLGLPTSSRVIVRYVNPESAAYAAGVRGFESSRDDGITPVPVRVENLHVITGVDGTAVTDLAEFQAAIESAGAGSTVTLDLLQVEHPPTGSVTTTPVTVDVPVMALLPDVSASGQALLDAIWAERRHELAMEQHRWFDIVRQGRAAAIFQALGKDFVAGVNDLYPIPAGEVQVAELQQNPGY